MVFWWCVTNDKTSKEPPELVYFEKNSTIQNENGCLVVVVVTCTVVGRWCGWWRCLPSLSLLSVYGGKNGRERDCVRRVNRMITCTSNGWHGSPIHLHILSSNKNGIGGSYRFILRWVGSKMTHISQWKLLRNSILWEGCDIAPTELEHSLGRILCRATYKLIPHGYLWTMSLQKTVD